MHQTFSIFKKLKENPEALTHTDLVKLVDEIRPSEADKSYAAEANLRLFIAELKENENVLNAFRAFIRNLILTKNHIRLFTELGISSNKGFFQELIRRINEK